MSAALLLAFATGCGSTEPIVIHPKLPEIAASQCPSRHPTFSLTRVEDKRGYADPSNVGFTQTGLYNVKASLKTDRPAATVVQDALVATMRRCGMLAESPSARRLTVELLALQISETDTLTAETMVGDLRYEVIVFDPEARHPLDRFPVTGHGQHSGVDTTDFAEQTLTEALGSSLPSFLRNLGGLPESPADASASPAVAEEEAPSQEENPIRVSVRPLTEDEQRNRFGTTLADKQILALEIRVERVGTVAHDLLFRRQDFRLTFAGDATRFPLDPTKLRERNRFSFPIFVTAGIVPIYAGTMNMGAQTKGLTNTVEQLTFRADARELRGTIFFDLEGAPGQPRRMDVSYEDLVTRASRAATAPYGAAQ